MTRVFFREELETVGIFWRIARTDGVTLGFTSHDKNLWFDGLLHRATPGMLPSAIRRTSGLTGDSAEVEGVLTHDALSGEDLANARFDGARIAIGAVDWQTLEWAVLYRGEVGTIGEEDGKFTAELRSAKAMLEADPVPRTSPTCRARFCGPGCALSATKFTHGAAASTIDLEGNRVAFADGPPASAMLDGHLRWLDGPQAGLRMEVVSVDAGWLVLDVALDPALAVGTCALLQEGCDHTLATCAARFANSVNFQGEPYLPGNDLLARYGTGSS